MRKFCIFLGAVLAFASCKPETYIGPLDSPIGNWDGVKTEYYFNGEFVGEAESCQYPAISFYNDGLCCIEGIKGAFPYTYENASGLLQIENTIWAIQTLTGAELIMEYLETTFPEDEEVEAEPDKNGLVLPLEYAGVAINADNNGYYYESGQERIYCNFFGSKDETGTLLIDFWYDRHTDYFIPLVVEPKK